MAAQDRSQHLEQALTSLFKGTKARWLPLFRRLAARLSRVPELEVHPARGGLALHSTGKRTALASIRILPAGLEIRLGLAKAALKSPRLSTIGSKSTRMTHKLLISEAREIDDELLLWIRAAQHQVRTARRRST